VTVLVLALSIAAWVQFNEQGQNTGKGKSKLGAVNGKNGNNSIKAPDKTKEPESTKAADKTKEPESTKAAVKPIISAEDKAKIDREDKRRIAEENRLREELARDKRVATIEKILKSIERYKGLKLLDHNTSLVSLKKLSNKVGEDGRLALQVQFEGLIDESYSNPVNGIESELNKLYQGGHYQRLSETINKAKLLFKQFDVDLPNSLKDLDKITSAALKNDAGKSERKTWKAASDEKDVIKLIALLEHFERDFAFSPNLSEAKKAYAEAAAKAPIIELRSSKGAMFTEDYKELGPSPWKGRLLVGRHSIQIAGPGLLTIATDIEVTKSEIMTVPGHPKPTQEMVQDVQRGLPFWNPTRFLKDWLCTGEWTVILAKSGVTAEAKGNFSTARRSLGKSFKRAGFAENPAWSLDVDLKFDINPDRLAEVRMVGGSGTMVVAGIDERRIYVGVRNGDKLVIHSQRFVKDRLDQSFQFDWDGSLVIVKIGKELLAPWIPPGRKVHRQ
jgi:hypothetical protein